MAATGGQVQSPGGTTIPAQSRSNQAGTQIFSGNAPATALQPATVGSAGGNQPHDNFQPYLCVDFIISLFGIFPSQT
jgi:microcystin-dependent protein